LSNNRSMIGCWCYDIQFRSHSSARQSEYIVEGDDKKGTKLTLWNELLQTPKHDPKAQEMRRTSPYIHKEEVWRISCAFGAPCQYSA
jgi:hypothetical protein